VRYTWLLMDADGTLFDYDKAEASALQTTFEATGYPFDLGYLELYRSINGRMWRAFEQGLITPDAIKVQRFEHLLRIIEVEHDPPDFSRTYLKHLSNVADLVDGAEETVRALSQRVGLVLITNGLQAVQRARIAKSTIGDCFTGIVISEEVGFSKPHAGIFDIAFQTMNHPDKADVLMVGDGLTSDIRGGNDYGIDMCWFNPQRRPRPVDVRVQYEIERLCQLKRIVGVDSLPWRVPTLSGQ
jgi:2-haloacid dehalogenase